MRVVFDTVVLVRGLIGPYGWWGQLVFDHAGHYELLVSTAIVAEYLDVIARPRLAQKIQAVAARDLSAILDIIAAATNVQPLDVPAICRDPADDKFLAAGKAGSARFIISEDKDLLDLGSYEGIQIVTAETFLGMLETDGTPGGQSR